MKLQTQKIASDRPQSYNSSQIQFQKVNPINSPTFQTFNFANELNNMYYSYDTNQNQTSEPIQDTTYNNKTIRVTTYQCLETENHQYLVQKYGRHKNDKYFDFDEILLEISDVFCIVCEQYIPQVKIDSHCMHCTGEKDENEQLESLQLKLQKCNFIISKIKKMLKAYSSDKQQIIQYLQMCWKCVDSIIQTDQPQDLQQQQSDLELFETFFDKEQDMLQSETQFSTLIQQIMTVLLKIKGFTNRKIQLAEILKRNSMQFKQGSILMKENFPQLDFFENGQISEKKNEMIQLKPLQVQPLQQIKNNCLIQVNSALEESFQQIDVEQSFASTNRIFQNNSRPSINTYNSPERQKNVYEEQIRKSPVRTLNGNEKVLELFAQKSDQKSSVIQNKTKFFQLAAQLKSRFSKNHIAQTVLVAGLYDKAIKSNIQQQGYERFILDYYEQL